MKQKQIFEITDAAASQIIKSSESTDSKDWPLRIAVSIAVSYTHLTLPTNREV